MKWTLSFLICLTAIFFAYITLSPTQLFVASIIDLSGLLRGSNTTYTTPTPTPIHPSHPHVQNLHLPISLPIVLSNTNMSTPRAIRLTLLAKEQNEGVGAVVRRSIGTPKLKYLTPFLMLDHFTIHPGAGFPDHPHRGQETITYLLSGGVDHEDFAGNNGTIGPGDLQFMTAGRGIMHAEMPVQNPDGSANVGMQLWVDLPEKLKGVEPRYRDLRADEIPTATADDGKVQIKVISGQSHGVDSVRDMSYTPVWILDITVKAGGKIKQDLPQGWNAFAYTLSGTVSFSNGAKESEAVTPFHNVVFEQAGDVVIADVEEGAHEDARFILVAGQPLDQNIVQYGPFVTTSREEVYQAMMDFQTNSNGFERALNWKSEIGKSMAHY